MDDMLVRSDGAWPCLHDGGHHTQLFESQAQSEPPHYIICPDCRTHWLVWMRGDQKWAKPVIIPFTIDPDEYVDSHK